ncbi:sulfatase family protein [Flavihumibacter sp. UBA7668]|uniref:sulfatase family protein n=1 Tax=Flavihumibacter sp. UBA7668 TaxID=1946542 RepID=UPI0025BA2056|nr:sulfatase [Flavihumibacter sp. UBA7668]
MKKFLLYLLVSYGVVANAQQKRPNILIIISDDHAFQTISAYGSKLTQTPAIDRIAKEGMLFNRAYVTNSICGPSRAVLLTGRYSHKNGFKDNVSGRFDSSQHTFIKDLTKSGYQTAWIGKWHLESAPQGFSYWKVLPGQGSYFNPDFIKMDNSRERINGYATTIIEDIAENWLDGRDTSKPFCLVIGHKATHRTWMPDIQDMRRFDTVNFPLPANFYDEYQGRRAAAVQDMTVDKTMIMGYDLKMFPSKEAADKDGNIRRMTPDQRAAFDAYYGPIKQDLDARNLTGKELVEWKYQRYMRDYLATAASLDSNIGRALEYLDRHKLTDNTLVIYLSDQGFYMGEHGWFDKRFMYEESFRTPMVMRFPGMIQAGRVDSSLVMNLDLAPTMLDLAGVKSTHKLQGESILPLLKQEGVKGRKNLYYHYYENGEHAVSPHFGISNGRYKLIRFYKRVESWELYDLHTDSSEMKNLYGRSGYEKITRKMKKELTKISKKFEDAEASEILKRPIGLKGF